MNQIFRELAFFFPKNNQQNLGENKPKQKTLALIRPSAFAQHKEAILKKIKDAGFEIAMAKTVTLDKKQAEDFYAEHKKQPFFNELINEMTRYLFEINEDFYISTVNQKKI